jgi:hypothetical protein
LEIRGIYAWNLSYSNAAKFRIEEAFMQSGSGILTCPEIASITGMPVTNVSRFMTHYHERGYGYFILR